MADRVIKGTSVIILDVQRLRDLIDDPFMEVEDPATIHKLIDMCTTEFTAHYILPGYLADKPNMIEYSQNFVKTAIGYQISHGDIQVVWESCESSTP